MVWEYLCIECDHSWVSDQPDPGREWCEWCMSNVEPEKWEIPEEFQEKAW